MSRFANLFALRVDLRTTNPMDRAVYTAAAEQRLIRGVYDRGYVVGGYVTDENADAFVKKRRKRV